MESSLNFQAQPVIGFVFGKSLVCIFIKGKKVPINGTFVFQVIGAHKYFRKFETKMVGSLLNIETIHNHNL